MADQKKLNDLNSSMDTLKQSASYAKIVAVASFFVVFGAVFYHIVEKLSWLNAFYFTTVTLATVGYGDIVPHTPAGKLFTMFYIFFGVTIFVILARIVVSEFAIRGAKRRNQNKED